MRDVAAEIMQAKSMKKRILSALRGEQAWPPKRVRALLKLLLGLPTWHNHHRLWGAKRLAAELGVSHEARSRAV